MTFGELIVDEAYIDILNSIMPGGENWDREYEEHYNKTGSSLCRSSCPGFHPNCGKGICRNWQKAAINTLNLSIILHVLHYFDYYNLNDLKEKNFNDLHGSAKELMEIFEQELEKEIVSGRFREIGETQRAAIVQARKGQGIYRKNLIRLWGKCSVTACDNTSLLKASHIRPWRSSTNEQRLDQNNGLLLIPNIDACFDVGLISFDEFGKIIFSEKLSQENMRILGLNENMRLYRKLNHAQNEYMEFHRKNILRS